MKLKDLIGQRKTRNAIFVAVVMILPLQRAQAFIDPVTLAIGTMMAYDISQINDNNRPNHLSTNKQNDQIEERLNIVCGKDKIHQKFITHCREKSLQMELVKLQKYLELANSDLKRNLSDYNKLKSDYDSLKMEKSICEWVGYITLSLLTLFFLLFIFKNL